MAQEFQQYQYNCGSQDLGHLHVNIFPTGTEYNKPAIEVVCEQFAFAPKHRIRYVDKRLDNILCKGFLWGFSETCQNLAKY